MAKAYFLPPFVTISLPPAIADTAPDMKRYEYATRKDGQTDGDEKKKILKID